MLRGANPNLMDSTGNSVIHRAVDVRNWEAAVLLVRFHADLSFPDPAGGGTVLQKLIKSTVPSTRVFVEEPSADEQAKVVDASLVWSCGVDYGATYKGKSTLHIVCQAGLWDTIRFIVARGGDPLAVTRDGRTVLWAAAENRHCAQRLVAECIKLGISTFQAGRDDDSGTLLSPFALSILRDESTVARMLYESGSCSNRELFRQFAEAQSEWRPAHEGLTETAHHGTFSSTPTHRQLREMATQPRSLLSLCRLVISHHLGVQRKRRKRVRQLPLSEKMRNYVLFSDIVHPDFGRESDE